MLLGSRRPAAADQVVRSASHNLSAGFLKSGNPKGRGALLPGTNSNDFRGQRREIPLEIEQQSLDPMKPPQTGFQPTRRFTLVARNVEFAPIAVISASFFGLRRPTQTRSFAHLSRRKLKSGNHALALGRADTSAHQRDRFLMSGGIVSPANSPRPNATMAVMSATV